MSNNPEQPIEALLDEVDAHLARYGTQARLNQSTAMYLSRELRQRIEREQELVKALQETSSIAHAAHNDWKYSDIEQCDRAVCIQARAALRQQLEQQPQGRPISRTSQPNRREWQKARSLASKIEKWIFSPPDSWPIRGEPTVEQITRIILDHSVCEQQQQSDVEAALGELRKMFVGQDKFPPYITAGFDPNKGWQNLFVIHIVVNGVGRHFEGAALSEAMQKVREWKREQQ